MTCLLTVLVLNDVLFSLIIGHPAMKVMKASLHFDKNVTVFRSEESKIVVPLRTNGEALDDQLSEEFTSNEEMSTESDGSRNDSCEADDEERLCDELELVAFL